METSFIDGIKSLLNDNDRSSRSRTERTLSWIVFPLLKAVAALVIIVSISTLLSTYFYYAYRPISLVKEPLYFDFSLELI